MQGDQHNGQAIAGQADHWVSAIEHMLRFDLRGRGITAPKILEVMAEIPRQRFVPSQYEGQAYDDRPLPIGLDQTISQPYIVALMTQALAVTPPCEVLEIGTGSGIRPRSWPGLPGRCTPLNAWRPCQGLPKAR